MDAFRMIDAPSGISGSAFCTVKRRPFTLLLKSASYFSSVIVPNGASGSAPPALANTISSLPFSRLICAKRRSRSPRFDTSPCTPVTFLPISFTAAANSCSRRPVMNTYAPSFTNCFAVARPMPPLPPVMSAILPSSLPIYFSFVGKFLVLHTNRTQIPLQLWRQRLEPLLFCARPWQHVTVFHHIVWREV